MNARARASLYLASLLCLSVTLLGCEPKAEGGPHVHDRILVALPVGSTFGQVTKYLFKEKIPYSVHGEAHTVQAMMNDQAQWDSPHGNVKTRYSLRFVFDNDDRLTALDVTEMHVAKTSGPPKSDSSGESGNSNSGGDAGPQEELPSSPHQ